MSKLIPAKIGDYLDIITDYHSNGAYKKLKENVELLDEENYAVIIRTLNFGRNDFKDDLLYVTKDAYDFLAKSYVLPDDILMNKIANAGSVYIMPDLKRPVTCGMNLFLLRFKKDVNQRYMYYNMKNVEKYIKSFAHGTTTTTITKDEVRNIDLWIHPKNEQDKIAELLSLIDSKIENNDKINNEIEAMAKNIYDYWFLQFEFPNEEGKPYKSSGGKMVWNEELKREIPEGWNVDEMSSCIDLISGYPFSSEDYVDEGKYKLYTIKNVQDGKIVSSVDNYLNHLPENLPHACCLKEGDLIMSLTGNVGRVGLVYENNALLNQRVLKLISKDSHKAYVYLLFRNNTMRTTLETIATGTSQKNLSPISLGKIKTIIPDNLILKKFDDICNGMIEKIVANNVENQELASLRDFLLPLLMNGQVGFKE